VHDHIQHRQHSALNDSREFFKVLRVVGFNLLLAVFAVLATWVALLQTGFASRNIRHLPRSYVPPLQLLAWYMINDAMYFYPHWIAHLGPATRAPCYRLLPNSLAHFLHKSFKDSHRLHHRSKANLGMAAWYCSPAEQLLFNLLPAFAGPVLTQLAADALGVSDTWGTDLIIFYVWLTAAATSSVLAHSGYRSTWNDPGKHDLHHDRAFDPKGAVNFGTFGLFDRIHGTASETSREETKAWRAQRDRQAALYEASRRTGIPLTRDQRHCVEQPITELEWTDIRAEEAEAKEKMG
jgi:sterol desaturase/sphingolipid hydroxylase (fatty acid hydroxylase superfamily)